MSESRTETSEHSARSQTPQVRRTLPRIAAGARRPLLARLLGWGMARALAAFAVAALMRQVMGGAGAGDAALTVAGLAGVGIALLALRVRERVDAERLGQDYVMKTRLRLFARLAAAPMRDAARPRLGTTMNRMISDLAALKNWVSRGVAQLILASVSLLGAVAALATLAPAAAWPMAVLAVCIVAAVAGLTPLLRRRVRAVRRRRGRLAGHLGDVLPALATVVHCGEIRREWRRMRGHSRALADASVSRSAVVSLSTALPDAAFPMGVAILVYQSLTGALAWEALVGALALLGLVTASLREMARAWSHRVAFEEARERLLDLLSMPVLQRPARPAALVGSGPLPLELRRVRHGPLRGMDMRLEGGERVALTGAAGSGKSTLLALAARLCDPDSGLVLLGERPAASLAPEELARAVRLVSPHLPLLRGTVGSNIAYGARDGAAVKYAARLCALDAACLARAVEEGGGNLPGSLRARIGLARAVAACPRLLLLDDPALLGDGPGRAVLGRVLRGARATVVVAGSGADSIGVDYVLHLDAGRLVAAPVAAQGSVLCAAG